MDEHESNSNPPPSKDHETENVCTESENVDVVEEDMDDSVKLKESSCSKKSENLTDFVL